jgi:hypothetical protein
MNFADLKKKSKSNLDNLVAELEKMSSGGNKYQDDRFWSVPMDEKTGNGTALIRFLPAGKNDKLPWVTVFSHSFQGPGGWYIENSLTTIGQQDPIGEKNTELWATGIEANKEIVRKRKRKQQYISNIYVISDPKNPQNEGKVVLWKFGKKIFEKIQEAMKPVFEGEKAVDPFDFWQGSNFRLKIKKVDGYPNYDNSSFEAQAPFLDGDDEKLEKVWNSLYALNEFTDPKNFKSYEELKARLDKVLGNKASAPKKSEDSMPSKPAPKMESKKASVTEDEDEVPWKSEETDEEDDSLDFFRKLAEE